MLGQRSSLDAATALIACALAFAAPRAGASTPPHLSAGEPSVEAVRALLDAGLYSEASAQARALVTRVAASSGAASFESAQALNLLVEALRRSGQASQPETRGLAERTVAVWEELAGKDDPRTTESLTNLALVLGENDDRPGALALLERVLAIRERALGPDDVTVAEALDNVGNAERERGDLAAAEERLRRALAIRERRLGPGHPEVAQTLNDLANARFEAGDLVEAQSLYERSAEVFTQSLGAEHPRLLFVLGNLGAVLRRRGEYAAAQEAIERALAGLSKTLGSDHPKTLVTVLQLANLLYEQGDYPQAKQLYERGLATEERRLGAESPELAAWLANLGLLLSDMGDSRAARAALERALAIREKTLPPDHPKRALTLEALAGVLLDADAPPGEIEPLLLQALAIDERTLGPEHLSVAKTETALAQVALRLGDDARARTILTRAVATMEQSLGPEYPYLSSPLVELAGIAERAHEAEQARAMYARAVTLAERGLGPVHPLTAAARAALAAHLARSADVAPALDSALAAEEAARQHVRLTLRSLGERQALLYSKTRTSGLDLAVSLLLDHPQAAAPRRRDVLDSVVRSRAMVLDEMAARQRAAADAPDPEIQRLAQQLGRCRERLARIVMRGPRATPLERYRALLDRARQAKERAEEAYAARSLPFRDAESRNAAGLAEVEKALPPSSALIAFVRYSRDAAGAPESAAAAYAAFVLRAGRAVEIVPLGSAEQVENAVTGWRRELLWEAQAPGLAPKRSLERCLAAGRVLRRRVWDPVVPFLDGVGLAFVVPEGALHLVNFAALPVDEGRYLLETGPLLHVLSAERDLLPPEHDLSGQGLLLVGAPEFASSRARVAARADRGATASCDAFRTLRFSALPSARREIEAIRDLWATSAASPAASRSVLLLEGADANEALFKEQAPGRRLVHLATHGFVLGGSCAAAAGNPLLRSGLALSGANRRQLVGPDVEDGILTSEEIAALNLAGVDWAVLSACETGLGDVAEGEGVFGLRRAFQVAGARSVIMSLWPVGDNSARIWMESLYRGRLRDHLSTAQAVQQASLSVLRRRRQRGLSTHPLYWAGFLAAGDWR